MNKNTKSALRNAAGAFVIFVATSGAQAQDADADEMTAIIQAIEFGWERADGTPFRKHFLDFDGARYVEGGGQNIGLSDLIDHHVEPEGDALHGRLRMSRLWRWSSLTVGKFIVGDMRHFYFGASGMSGK